MKIVINNCFGGFGLSKLAVKMLGIKFRYGKCDNEDLGIESENEFAYRSDERLIGIVEKIGRKANGSCASLSVVEIPDDVNWTIDEYDGKEWVAEVHRTWGE